jgi:hypothetical protein
VLRAALRQLFACANNTTPFFGAGRKLRATRVAPDFNPVTKPKTPPNIEGVLNRSALSAHHSERGQDAPILDFQSGQDARAPNDE